MTLRKPIGYIPGSAIRLGRSPEHGKKSYKIVRRMTEILNSHLLPFVLDHIQEAGGSLQEKMDLAREDARRLLKSLESPEDQSDDPIFENDKESTEAFALLNSALKADAENDLRLSDEELIEELKEAEKEIASEEVWEASHMVVAMIIEAFLSLFEKGTRSLSVRDFVDTINLSVSDLSMHISNKHYPVIKGILRAVLPEMMQESYMDVAEENKQDTHIEVCYLEGIEQIVARRVDFAIIQTWINS